ncbi:MAG: hypothetical protein H7334_10635 [Ferruginibacter sp.]|nr:hypothetical protein [Ferruginibacter sp.]
MVPTHKSGEEIMEKVRIGLELSFKKLVRQKSLTDGTLAFRNNGKIEKVKARDLLDKVNGTINNK